MRLCPQCRTEYADDVDRCAHDGSRLQVAAAEWEHDVSPQAAVDLSDVPTVPAFPAVKDVPPLTAAGGGLPALAAAPSSEGFDSLVGATLAGRYQIIRRIGEGGMGAVYEARHTIIGKRVAVKVLLEKFLTKSDFVARLLQEARLASAIGHEHIVDVTDFGTTDDGRAFVAMEFLDGESLAQLVMREAPLPVERSLRIARQVASALGAAHAKGIVHRDVKPENVYLIRRGDADFVKVVDFGISKAVKQGQGDDTPDYHLTHTGLLLGTPLYMSPEQARGDEDLDHRVDVWAMGVMLYECLTAEVPFRANNYLGIISQVLTHTALPPSRLRPELGIPEAVEAVVMRAMEKDRARRYAEMADVERDLERLLAGDQNVGSVAAPPATAPPPRGPARGRVWVWGAAVAALVAGVAMVLARPEGTPPASADGVPPSEPGLPVARGKETIPLLERRPPRDEAASPPADRGAPAKIVAAEEQGIHNHRSDRALKRPTPVRSKVRVPNEDKGPPNGPPAARTGPGDKASPKADDRVIRGVLPSRSGEGYPDN